MASKKSSGDWNYDDVEEVDAEFDVVEPAFVLVYRRLDRPSGTDCRFVSCVRVEVTRRFCRRIFGEATTFVDASVFFWDMDDREQWRTVTVPSQFTFDEAPDLQTAKTVVTQNRTLFRHFAPILKGGPAMRLLYERPLFKIRCEKKDAQPSPPKLAREIPGRYEEPPLRREFEQMTIGNSGDGRRRDHVDAQSIRSLDTLGGASLVPESTHSGGGGSKGKKTLLGRLTGSRVSPSRGSRETATKTPRASHRRGGEKRFSIDVNPHETVAELKQKIYEARGYPVDMQVLVFNGAAMLDDVRLVDFDISEDSTLTLLLRNEDGTMKRVEL